MSNDSSTLLDFLATDPSEAAVANGGAPSGLHQEKPMTQLDTNGGSCAAPKAISTFPTEARSALLSDIATNADVHCRAKVDPGRIRMLIEAIRSGAEIEELTVARVGDGLVLVDGYHRYAALRQLGTCDFVNVCVLSDVRTLAEARWAAFWLHWRAALPLTRKERREGFRAYVRARNHRTSKGGFKSFRQIGRELSLSHRTIGSWMRSDFPSVWRAIAQSDAEPPAEPFGDSRFSAEEAVLTKAQHLANQLVATARLGPQVKVGVRAVLASAIDSIDATSCSVLGAPIEPYDF
jgi:hypothetical protein